MDTAVCFARVDPVVPVLGNSSVLSFVGGRRNNSRNKRRMVADSASLIAGISFIIAAWGTNLATDCFRTCREAFALVSRNFYTEKLRVLRKLLGVEKNSYNCTTNLEVMPRIFKELGIFTREVQYKHDANAVTEDGIQYGWHRLPTKSKMLSFFAYLEITHYVDMSYKQDHIEIVGPTNALKVLIECVNEAATSKLTPSQKESLCREFGFGDHFSEADVICLKYERRGLAICSWGSMCVIEIMLPLWVYRIPFLMFFFIFIWWNKFGWQRSTEGVVTQTDEGEVIGLLGSLEEGSTSDADTTNVTVDEETKVELGIFTMMTAGNRWFETSMQVPLPDKGKEPWIQFRDSAQAYVVPYVENLSLRLVERVRCPEGATLHVCCYNPMTDVYLPNIAENFKKGVRLENLLLVVFPSVGSMDALLDDVSSTRVTLRDNAQYVATEADLESLLQRMTPGINLFPKLVFVLPWDNTLQSDHRDPTGGKTWQVFRSVLQPENCFWLHTKP